MLTIEETVSVDSLHADVQEQRDWLLDFLVHGPDRPIPSDYGRRIVYLTDQLSRSNPITRATIANAASDLLTDASLNEQVEKADLLEVLAEVAVDSPAAAALAAPFAVNLLAKPWVREVGREQKQALHLLSKCPLPDRDWLPLIRPYLDSADTAMLAYLAVARQSPDQAPALLSQVLGVAEKAGIPTALFLFKVRRSATSEVRSGVS